MSIKNVLKYSKNKDLKAKGYNPQNYYNENAELKAVLDMILNGEFSPDNKDAFKAIFDSVVYYRDTHLLLADYTDYIKAQEKVSELYKNHGAWTKKAILNSARMGYFSSDRTVMEYANEIWKVTPVHVGERY